VADLDHRRHARRLAAALGADVDLERGEGGLLVVVVAGGGRSERLATNATAAPNAWRWAAEHLARQAGEGDAFAAARRAYQDAARAEFEGRAADRAEDRVGP